MSHHHEHGFTAQDNKKWLYGALVVLVLFMAAEIVVGVYSGSLALLSDAAHMLTDIAALVLALVAMTLSAKPAKGSMTYGLRRADILSAQINGATLLVLGGWFFYEGINRLFDPPQVAGKIVLLMAIVGVATNLLATLLISKANRRSLNVEGAFQHVLSDLYAFIATGIAGLVMWVTDYHRADALAALVVAVLMLRSGWGLVRTASRVLLEAAPVGFSPDALGAHLIQLDDVIEIHDLHVWEISTDDIALSAHVLVAEEADCHERCVAIRTILHEEYGIHHSTLQVDHYSEGAEHCEQSHGRIHRADPTSTALVDAHATMEHTKTHGNH